MGLNGLPQILRPSWAPVRLALWLTSRFLGWNLVALPRFTCRWVPHASAVLSIIFLYIFAQALGLMWLLLVNLCSVLSVRCVSLIQGYFSDDSEEFDIRAAISSLLTGYVHYCILRILFFVGASFYSIGWEAFSDFPTVHRLVVGRHKPSSTDGANGVNGTASKELRSFKRSFNRASRTSTQETSEEEPSPAKSQEPTPTNRKDCEELQDMVVSNPSLPPMARNPSIDTVESIVEQIRCSSQGAGRRRKRRRFFREATLLAPLLGLIACELGLAIVTGICQVKGMSCDSSVFLGSLTHPTGRLNRGIRFVLFTSFLQWAQAFYHLFPTWHRGLMSTFFGKIWSLLSMLLWPLALGRLLQWSIMPAGTGITQRLLGYFPHHLVDITVMLVLKCWMLGTCICVLKTPDLSGFDRRRLVEDDDWKEMSTLFKYWFLAPMSLHFLRGCLKFGFHGAQNDLLVIVCAYPLLLVSVWTIVWAVVVAPGMQLFLAGLAGSLSLASTICSVTGSGQAGATIVVWLHLMRQYLKMFIRHDKHKARSRPTSSAANMTEDSSDASPPRSKRDGEAATLTPIPPHPRERQMGNMLLIISGLIALTFFAVLFTLAVIASYQRQIDWYPTTIFFDREKDPSGLRVDHTVSRLLLRDYANTTSHRPLGQTGSAGVSYSVCGHSWHGLSILDYALLSLASYFDAADPALRELLDSIFPKSHGVDWQLRNLTSSCRGAVKGGIGSGSRLSWMEVEIHEPTMEKPLLVIAIRGTDPVRVSDYVEDIRMWTEPVALSILSTVFPTVRAWSRRTVEMIITGIHEFLGSLGMPSDSWSYLELVECIARIPRDQYSQIVLTGHSLGGGMATVVAALTHLPVVAISPPGIYWSLAKHARLAEDRLRPTVYDPVGGAGPDVASWMHHQSLTLVVENDWVNGIFDDHGGLVQMMTCDRSQESLELACHMLEGTICHIFNRCGDSRNRWESCTHEYVLKDTVTTTATKVLREVLPPDIEDRFAGVWAWAQQFEAIQDPGSRIFGNAIALLVIFFVVLPIIGGIIEKVLF